MYLNYTNGSEASLSPAFEAECDRYYALGVADGAAGVAKQRVYGSSFRTFYQMGYREGKAAA